MFARVITLVLGTTMAAAYAASPAQADLSKVYAAMLAEFSDRSITNGERHARLVKHYSASTGVLGNMAAASDESLRATFSMSEAMLVTELGYSQPLPQHYVADMSTVFQELVRRDAASVEQRIAMIGAHLSIWQIEEAGSLAVGGTKRKGRGIIAIERGDNLDPATPAVVLLSGTDGVARVKPYEFRQGPTVVVSAGCHVARAAMEAISADDQLSTAFRQANALWLSPASTTIDTLALDQWNASFPATRMHIAFDNAKWQGVDFSRLPSFHFYKDGKLVMRVNGWSDDAAAREQIWAGLASIGIHPAPAPARAGSVGLRPTVHSDSGRSKAEPTVR